MESADPQATLLCLGVFELNLTTGELRKKGIRIRLQPQPYKVLVLLLQHPGELVTREQLRQKLWREDTFVDFEHALNFAVKKLREALDDDAEHPRYIETLPRRGYRYIGPLERAPIPAAQPGVSPRPPSATQTGRVISISEAAAGLREHADLQGGRPGGASERETEAGVPPSAAPDIREDQARLPKVRRGVSLQWAWLAVAAAAILGVVILRTAASPPKVFRIRQLTHIGNLVNNTKIITDGPRVYFRTWEEPDRAIRYVSPAGGEVFPVKPAFPRMDIDDISPNGAEFLVVELSEEGPHRLWRVPVPSGSPRPVGTLRANDSRWSPDGGSIVYSVGSDLYLANSDGSDSNKIATVPGDPTYLPWSPDGDRLRFSLVDPGGAGIAIWEANLNRRSVGPLSLDCHGSRRLVPGGWTPDGRYFFLTALDGGANNVWVLREQAGVFRWPEPQPVQLTAGPLVFYQPTPSKDGKSVFVIGEQPRGQLMRYDSVSRQFKPYAQDLSADQVAFSRDGRWMAYVEFPEAILVRSRLDGSDRRQLTFPPMRALNPQWSPDGTQLAFQGYASPGAPGKIYLVPREGGEPALAGEERPDHQIYPSWSYQGDSIVLTSFDRNGSNPALYRLDLKTRRISQLPGTAGLSWGQISPDGLHIAALADASLELKLYDLATHDTRTLAKLAEYPHWSPDGTFVYFRTPYFRRGVENPGVYRWVVSTDMVQKVASDPEFRLNGVHSAWCGFAPDGSLLLVRDVGVTELYALDVELP